ncbi:MAG: transporter [Oscillospiraceae bacterium]
MDIAFRIACSVTVGLILGFLIGLIKTKVSKRAYTPAQVERAVQLRKKASTILKYITFCSLLIGLVWTVYYLILGAVDPAQSGYAVNLSQLITGVLTVVSILFAFFEFLGRK